MKKIPVIPYPQSVLLQGSGKTQFSSNSNVLADSAPVNDDSDSMERFAAQDLCEFLETETVVCVIGNTVAKGSQVLLRNLNASPFADSDYYRISVDSKGMTIEAAKKIGFLYAAQTAKQLFYAYRGEIPHMIIEDWTLTRWRGFMLDTSRHFCPVDEIKRIIDLLLLHKLNIFHWHGTDDQGWRFEIEAYPRLTEIGSVRSSTQTGGRHSNRVTLKQHSGFYTKAEIRDVVAYAGERGIMVIPEVDMPGHTVAALAAYPELCCSGNSTNTRKTNFTVPGDFGIFKDTLCPGKESVRAFAKTVMHELCDLFPAPWFHIGGDEAPTDRWEHCPDCAKRMKKLSLGNPRELQTDFTRFLADAAAEKGKKIIGWDEITNPNLDSGAVIQYWNPFPESRRNFRRSLRDETTRQYILSPYFKLYLDHPYAQLPLRKVYRYGKKIGQMKKGYGKRILGAEVPLWTEWVPDREIRDWQIFPRLTAFSEIIWKTGIEEGKNRGNRWSDFAVRLESFTSLLQDIGVSPAPKSAWKSSSGRRFAAVLELFRNVIRIRADKKNT